MGGSDRRGQYEIGRFGERFGEIQRIVNHRGDGEYVAVAGVEGGDHGLIACGNSVAANPSPFEMSGGGDECIADPFPVVKPAQVWGA